MVKDTLQRVGLLLGFVLLLIHYFPFSAGTCIVFGVGILFTIVLELGLFIWYLSRSNPNLNPEGFLIVNKQLPEESISRTRTYIPQKMSEDVKPCYCSSDEFKGLVSGKDICSRKLIQFTEDLVTAERLFGQHLARLGESSLLDKIKMKNGLFAPESPWTKLRVTLNTFGQKRIQESEHLRTGTSQYLLEVRKRVKSRLKTLRETQISEASRFTSVVTRLQKLSEKLDQAKEGERTALTAYDSSKKDLAAFPTLVKHEMKVKLAKNETDTLRAKIREAQDELKQEATGYLTSLQPLVEECKELIDIKSGAAKVAIQAWIESLQHLFSEENLAWADLVKETEGDQALIEDRPRKDSDFANLTNWITKKLNIQEETEQLFFLREREAEHRKMANVWGEMQGFVMGVSDALNFYSKELVKISTSETHMTDLGLQDSWQKMQSFLNQLASLAEDNAKELRETLLSCSQTPKAAEQYTQLLTRAKEDGGSTLNPVLESEMQSLKAAAHRESLVLRAALLHTLEASFQVCNEMLSGMEKEVIQKEKPTLEFEAGDFGHSDQCPHYKIPFAIDDEDAQIYETGQSIGEPESALWFNCLFSTFLKEWTESQRFLAYLCRRLKKVYNKDRPNFLGEIAVPKVVLEGKSPEINRIVQLESDPGNFLHECDLWYKGAVEIYLEFEAHWTVASVPIAVKVVLRSIYGRVRVFFCPSAQGKSWYSFVAEPAYQVLIQPVLGRHNKVELSRFPQLNSVLTAVLARKIRKFVWPNRRSVKIPLARTAEVKLH